MLDEMENLRQREMAKIGREQIPRFVSLKLPSNLASKIVLISLVLSPFLVTVADASWIDPDTPMDVRTTQSYIPRVPVTSKEVKKHRRKKSTSEMPTSTPTDYPTYSPTTSPTAYPTSTADAFHLVFSDEFNTPGRSFDDGHDPRWTSLDKNDYTNDALHYYSPKNIKTNDDGELVITTEAVDTDVVGFDDVQRKHTHVTKHFRSAMVQSWNKFCFTGGIIEAEVKLPGRANVGGLWPAFWILGNLARHTYVGSSQHVWPWSSVVCTEKSFDAQLISGCDRVAHYGLEKGVGRGAPEIDIFEVQPGPIKANTGPFLETPVGQPFMSASFQVAPGKMPRPGDGWWPAPGVWYEGLQGGNSSALNIRFYGSYNHFRGSLHPERSDYWSDAISYNRQLDERHFNGTHVYRLEWDVPNNETDGYLRWYLDGELVLSIDGTGVKAAGVGSQISSEPSYIIMNTAVSSQWGFPLECPGSCDCKKYDCNSKDYQSICGFSEGFCDMMKAAQPPQYKMNWVRVYQNPSDKKQKVGCSTPERPSRRYILAHEKLYKTDKDEHPLKAIQVGLGTCDPKATGVTRNTCGGADRGRCTAGRVCECFAGWTGPHCLARDGYNPIEYDVPPQLSDVGFIPPKLAPRGLIIVFAVLVAMLLTIMHWRSRFEGWTPIPDVDSQKLTRS